MFQSGIRTSSFAPCSSSLHNLYTRLFPSPVFLTDAVTNKIAGILNDLIASVRTIATPLAVIGLIFCMIKIFTSPDERTVRTAKQGALWILVAVAVIWLAEPIIGAIQSIAN